jgi:hypothetical protein
MRKMESLGYALGLSLVTMLWLSPGPASAQAKPVSWDASAYAQYKIRDFERIDIGDFSILNDPWGKKAITLYRQAIFKESDSSDTPFGWKWDWPKVKTDDVKTYQSLTYGWNPWMEKGTNAVLPVKAGWIASLRVDYAAEVNAGGKYNLSFDVWIAKQADNTVPNELNVTREFMVWVDRKEAGIDSYWFVGRVKIGGEDYDFYRIPDLKGTLSKRDFMIFIKVKPMPAGSLELADFLAYMLKKKYLTEEEFVKNIDFGDEVWYGEGETTISRFDVSLTTK